MTADESTFGIASAPVTGAISMITRYRRVASYKKIKVFGTAIPSPNSLRNFGGCDEDP